MAMSGPGSPVSAPRRVRVRLHVDLGSPRRAGSALSALLPDNVQLPEGMEIEMRAERGGLVIEASHSVEGADTLAATLVEVLEHARLAGLVAPLGDGD
jgi:hypothetical protein